MGIMLSGFDATQVKPHTGFELWPDGWVKVVIQDMVEKPVKDAAKAQQGQTVTEVVLRCVEGPLMGAINYNRLNLKNPNDTAVRISREHLSAMCHVVGILRPQNSAELYEKPFYILCSTETSEQGQKNQRFTKYKDIYGNDPGQAGGQQAASPFAAPAPQAAPVQQQPAFSAPQQTQQPATQPAPQQFAPQAQQPAGPGYPGAAPQTAPQPGFDPNYGQQQMQAPVAPQPPQFAPPAQQQMPPAYQQSAPQFQPTHAAPQPPNGAPPNFAPSNVPANAPWQ